jgi:hypothetical protein
MEVDLAEALVDQLVMLEVLAVVLMVLAWVVMVVVSFFHFSSKIPIL